jgi:hypothetical protein
MIRLHSDLAHVQVAELVVLPRDSLVLDMVPAHPAIVKLQILLEVVLVQHVLLESIVFGLTILEVRLVKVMLVDLVILDTEVLSRQLV